MSAKNAGRCLSYNCNICYMPLGFSGVLTISLANLKTTMQELQYPLQVLEIPTSNEFGMIRFPFYDSTTNCIRSWSHTLLTPCGHIFHKVCLTVCMLIARRERNPRKCPSCQTQFDCGIFTELDIPVYCNKRSLEKTDTTDDNNLNPTAKPNAMNPACDNEVCNRRAELQATTHVRMDETVTESCMLARTLYGHEQKLKQLRLKSKKNMKKLAKAFALCNQAKEAANRVTMIDTTETRSLTPAPIPDETTTSTDAQDQALTRDRESV